VLAEADHTPTLIFDEVDVGVGGRHGTVVGERLRGLADNHQVISITHLPQIAALADHHINVGKSLTGDRATVVARPLDRSERVQEIAEMLSGRSTSSSRQNAEELLEAAQRSVTPR
jgi:DNA repair protein RecN (Recombination protein N)